MNKGVVKWFNAQKGYGFILDETGISLFVHYSDLNMTGYKALDKGQPVEYEIKEGTKGPQAINVVKLYSI